MDEVFETQKLCSFFEVINSIKKVLGRAKNIMQGLLAIKNLLFSLEMILKL